MATSLVAPERKARAVSLMFPGLTVANIAGVPAATLMGQHLGWRATFLGVSVIGLAAMAALALLIPHDHTRRARGGLRRELSALRSLPVWLALGTTVAGFGALFAAYSYITPMLTDSAGYADGPASRCCSRCSASAPPSATCSAAGSPTTRCGPPCSAASPRWPWSSPCSRVIDDAPGGGAGRRPAGRRGLRRPARRSS